MDPAGLGLGAVSLLFSIFSGCITAYSIISEARGLEKKYRYFRVRFKTEQYRLLDWGKVAEVAHRESTFLKDKSNRAAVVDVLDEQYRMLMSFGRLDERYMPLASPLLCEDVQGEQEEEEGNEAGTRHEDKEQQHDPDTSRFPDADKLLQKALALTTKTAKLPRRLRWAILDRDKMEDLLGRLGHLNDNLRDMLHGHHLEVLRAQEVRTGFQVIQLNSKMDQLLDIIRAGTVAMPTPAAAAAAAKARRRGRASHETTTTTTTVAHVHDSRDFQSSLVQLAQFKAVSRAVEEGQALDGSLRSQIGLGTHPWPSAPKSMRIAAKDLELGEPLSLSGRKKGGRRLSAYYRDDRGARRRVWVELRRLDSPQRPYIPWPPPQQKQQQQQQPPSSVTLRRFEALVALLRENEVTSQFSAPRCLGYFVAAHDDDDPRASGRRPTTHHGLVFENPAGARGGSRPTSLRELLVSGRRAPSLTRRVRLMQALSECVERLHAVDWLHKGLRSENVIFFSFSISGGEEEEEEEEEEEAGEVDLSRPFLSGFDYSRPSASTSLSEGPVATDLADDLYRHPQVQGRAPPDEYDDASASAGSGRGFRRHHDIYSLGIVLTEIASWKPLETILGLGVGGAGSSSSSSSSSSQSLTERDVLGVREALLSRSYRESLESRLGDTISRVIGNCIDASAAFAGPRGPSGGGGEEEEVGEGGMQARFYTTVVKELAGVRI